MEERAGGNVDDSPMQSKAFTAAAAEIQTLTCGRTVKHLGGGDLVPTVVRDVLPHKPFGWNAAKVRGDAHTMNSRALRRC